MADRIIAKDRTPYEKKAMPIREVVCNRPKTAFCAVPQNAKALVTALPGLGKGITKVG